MGIKIHEELEQGSDAWLQERRGLLTASVMKTILTTEDMDYAKNKTARSLMLTLAAQRISGIVEPEFVSDHMIRGTLDEVEAKILYSEKYAEVVDVGFITNDTFGFTLGYSPDGLVGADGVIEIKSRLHKFQLDTIMCDTVPSEYMVQIQAGLLISGRKWCDFISYSSGMPMYVKRVRKDDQMQACIKYAAAMFEIDLRNIIDKYNKQSEHIGKRLTPTVRKVLQEIFI